MATVVGVTLVKKFNYRGDTSEEYSNQYWLTGAVPASAGAWSTLANALIASEKVCYPASVVVVRAYGYDSDEENAASVFSWDYEAATTTVPGTLSTATGVLQSGDSAAWIRWRTSRLNTKGKPIYLRKYFHPAQAAGTTAPSSDQILPAQRTALEAHGTKLMDGSFLDARTLRSQHHDETLMSRSSSTYVTTRTLKRRGKRPSS